MFGRFHDTKRRVLAASLGPGHDPHMRHARRGSPRDVLPAAYYRALPSGVVADDVVEAFLTDLLPVAESAARDGVAGIYLVLLGAMSSESCPNVEGLVLDRLRAVPESGVGFSVVTDSDSEAADQHQMPGRTSPILCSALRSRSLRTRCTRKSRLPAARVRAGSLFSSAFASSVGIIFAGRSCQRRCHRSEILAAQGVTGVNFATASRPHRRSPERRLTAPPPESALARVRSPSESPCSLIQQFIHPCSVERAAPNLAQDLRLTQLLLLCLLQDGRGVFRTDG